jgi:hypothetical protein
MQHYSSQVFTDLGKPAGGATITVKLPGTNTNATIYSDDGVTLKSNPFVANSLGQFDFYTASGKYDINVSGTQITTYTLANQIVFDPFEVSNGDSMFASNGTVPMNSVGVGGFFGVTIMPPFNTGGPSNANSIVASANQVFVFQFILPFPVTVNKVSMSMFATSGSAGAADVGVYSITGNRLVHTNGAINIQTPGTQVLTVVQGPVTLAAGMYYFAQTANNSAGTYNMVLQNGPWEGVLATSPTPTRYGAIAANASSGGVLPATLGTLAANATVPPMLAFFER